MTVFDALQLGRRLELFIHEVEPRMMAYRLPSRAASEM